MNTESPKTARAVQLTGPDQLRLNPAKPVPEPGPRQLLCRVEVVGLCFSDLKLLKQFSAHVRKSEVVAGIDAGILKGLPGYVPGEAPTVPGHETVVRVVRVGGQVTRFKPGERYLVQADWRWIRTASSNAAFGYNFEGALQEYVLLDERIILSPDGESMLIPVSERKSASALALVEPWACVEDAYATRERQTLKPGGRLLVVADAEFQDAVLPALLQRYGQPAQLTWASSRRPPALAGPAVETAGDVSALPDGRYDDAIYFGSAPDVVESLFPKLAANGLLNLVLCGGRLGRPVVTALGRIHYGGLRIVGTPGSDPAEGLSTIPATGELRTGDVVHVVGAGGPMGVMHVVRSLCQGVKSVTVVGSDLSDDRLEALQRIAGPLAEKRGLTLQLFNPQQEAVPGPYDYLAIMAPVPALVAQAVRDAAQHGTINIFAGIPAQVTGELDLDAYIDKGLYVIGTSGSTLADMKAVLRKVEGGRLDTNLSVAAVSGLEGAVDGIRAVEKNLIPGKILVYPACRGLELTPLDQLRERLPKVARKLRNGTWTLDAERALLAGFSPPPA